MIEGLKPYPEYKESGVPWTSAVPTHWNVHNVGQIGRLLKGSGGSKADNVDEGLPCVRYGQLYTKYRGFIHAPKTFIHPSKVAQYTAIRYGDVLFAASGEKVDEIGKSAVNLMRNTAFCGGDVIILRPRMDTYPAFFGYALDSYASASQKATMCRGSTIKHIYPDELRLLGVTLPPPAEQAAIVRFLDHANRKIDGFIRAKRKLIGLLNEQKQAIIHRAVTRGLNPDVPMKPSGIPWLGEIPGHWEVMRAKYLFREVDNRSKEGKETHLAMSQRLGLVPSSMVDSAMRSESYAGAKLCREGDLVLNRLKAHLGVFALAKQSGVISPDYSVFRKRTGISMEYFESVLKSSACRRELRIRAKGLVEGFWRLYTDDFYDIRLPVPPLDEQKEIMSVMTADTVALTTAIARTEREIALMQEYRTRLTADLVTGKLDVREAAAKLPDPPADAVAEPLTDDSLEDSESEDADT